MNLLKEYPKPIAAVFPLRTMSQLDPMILKVYYQYEGSSYAYKLVLLIYSDRFMKE